jgi:hypothetical protein
MTEGIVATTRSGESGVVVGFVLGFFYCLDIVEPVISARVRITGLVLDKAEASSS